MERERESQELAGHQSFLVEEEGVKEQEGGDGWSVTEGGIGMQGGGDYKSGDIRIRDKEEKK